MRKLLLALGLLTSFSLHAQTQRYDKEKVRKNLLTRVLVPQQIVVKGELPKDEKKRAFIEMYLKEIQPELETQEIKGQISGIFTILIDNGLENSPQEKQRWTDEYNRLTSELNAYSVDPVWTAKVLKWGKLAEGLTGELPDFARHLAKGTELGQFPESMKATLDEIEKKYLEYSDAVNNTEAAKHLSEYMQARTTAEREFKSGNASFEETQAKINELQTKWGFRFVGHEAAQSAGHLLNEMAIMRSKLAKSKARADGQGNYKTWAEYKLDASGQGYSPELRGPTKQREFLEKWLAKSAPVEKAYYERRLKEMGLGDRLSTIKSQHTSLMSPPDLTLAQPYFPPEKISDIWEKAMLNSGFDPKMMKPIIIDDLPRAGKNGTNAYMAALITPAATARELDPETLNLKDIGPSRDPLIYVSQNFRGSGLSEFRTGLHELTGHAFDYLTNGVELGMPIGYGYVETPSMGAEYFADSPEFLHSAAVPKDGKKPSLEEFKEWVKNQRTSDALSNTFMATSSLFDLNLWDYDYDQPGAKTFLERVEEVSKDIDSRSQVFPDADSPVPLYYFWISTMHFVSGEVRNIGYTFATISSEMIARYISERLQTETGRAQWSDNPAYANILINEVYKQGRKMAFPESIVKITGKPYDVNQVLSSLLEPLCENTVTN